MKSRLVRMLRCPACRGELQLHAGERDSSDGQVMSGALRCDGCGKSYALTDGIPRLLAGAASALEQERRWTASRFGYLWSRSTAAPTAAPAPYHFEKIQAAVGLPPASGLVLDAGCGEGVDLENVGRRPGVEMVGVELSDGGVAASFARTRRLDNIHVIQGDLRMLPLADETFDLVYSYGVVHHLTPPEAAMGELARVARRGAVVAIYVYEDFATRALALRVGLRAVNSMRGVTTRLSPRVLFALCRMASPLVFGTCTLPHRLLRNVPGLRAIAAGLPFRHGTHAFGLSGDLFDRFSAPIELRFSREGTAALLRGAGLEDVRLGYERGWVGAASKPARGG